MAGQPSMSGCLSASHLKGKCGSRTQRIFIVHLTGINRTIVPHFCSVVKMCSGAKPGKRLWLTLKKRLRYILKLSVNHKTDL
jgi:hypothetical protein